MEFFFAFMAILFLSIIVLIPGTVYLCVRAHAEATFRNRIRWGSIYKKAGINQAFLPQYWN